MFTCWIIPNSGDTTLLIPNGRPRGEGEKFFIEVRLSKVNSHHWSMPAGISWSIKEQHAPDKLDSRWRFAEQLSPNIFAISGVSQPVLQMKTLEGKIHCKSFKELLPTCILGKKMTDPKNIFQFLFIFIFVAPQDATIFRVVFFSSFLLHSKTYHVHVIY